MAKKKRAKKSKKKSRKKKIDIFKDMTDRIIEMIDRDGVAPWHKPWNAGAGLPTNLKTGKIYRGINVFTLGFSPYSSHYWLTFKQAKELAVKEARGAGRKIKEITKTKDGKPCRPWFLDEETGEMFKGGVREGEKKYGYVVFWKNMVIEDEDKEGEENGRSVPALRYTPIFNLEQTQGITPPKPVKRKNFFPIDECERVIKEYKQAPKVTHGGNRAYYSPQLDYIKVPKPEDFDGPEAYYNVLFHEHVHGTGHSSRLARKTLMSSSYFGSHQYSEEELVAEMGASFLAAHCGIATPPLVENTAAYLKHWLAQMKGHPKLLVHSASRAQRAFDFMLGVKFEESDDTERQDKPAVVSNYEMEVV